MRFFTFILLIFSTLIACKSGFEAVRTSTNSELILRESIKYYDKGEYLKAQTLMELVLNQYRGTREGEELFFKYAYTHYKLGSYALASTYFTNFSSTFPYSTFAEESDFMIAYSYYQQSPSFRLDQTPSVEAINAFQDFANKFPESDRILQCNELIDELRSKLEVKAYNEGILYFNLSKFKASITSFDNMLSQYPESVHAEEARYLMIKAAYDYAINSVYDKRAERLDDAMDRYQDYINRYPNGKHIKEVKELHKQIESESKNLS